MALHFSRDEFAGRRAATRERVAEAGLDGLLMFRQESMYYLTGYDTFGYVYFQCLYLGADGTMTLLTRAPDLRQARHTSTIDDIRIWVDRAGATPAEDLKAILEGHGCRGKRLGVELEAYQPVEKGVIDRVSRHCEAYRGEGGFASSETMRTI